MKLHIATDITLPVDAVTETFAIIARKGAGKTYLALKMAEELLRAGQQVLIIDLVGVTWGLRSSANGKAPGYKLFIAGGDHADLPLADGDGRTLADAAVDFGASLILDLSHLSKAAARRVVGDFCQHLYERKGPEKHRTPLHLFIDEADEFAPQRLRDDSAKCFGAVDTIVRRGRARGLGCTLITQRPAALNKDVLTQAGTLVAMRLIGPQDRAAVQEWVNAHGDPQRQKEVMATLASLEVGEAWWWSPGKPFDLFCRSRTLERRTFDSSSTPKVAGGGSKVGGREARLAEVDIETLRGKLGEAIERARANDPAALKKRVAELEREVAAAAKGQRAKGPNDQSGKPVIDQGAIDRAVAAARKGMKDSLVRVVREQERSLARAEKQLRELGEALGALRTEHGTLATILEAPTAAARAEIGAKAGDPSSNGTHGGSGTNGTQRAEGLSGRQQRFLDAAASLAALGAEVTRETVSAWVGVHPRGGSVGEELAALARAGLIEIDRGRITVTAAGFKGANTIDRAEAIESAKSALSPRQRRFFELIEAAYPDEITREQIAEACNLHPRGGSVGEDLGRLVGRGLVTAVGRGRYRARQFLFAGGAA